MDEQEKKQYLKEVTSELLLQNKTKQEILQVLEEKGGNPYEITKIYKDEYRKFISEREDKITQLLEIGTSHYEIAETISTKEKNLPESELLQIIEDIREKLINQRLGKYNVHIQNGVSVEQILEEEPVDDFMTREMITDYYARVSPAKSSVIYYATDEDDSDNSEGQTMKGIAFIVGGIIATAVSYSMAGSGGSYIAFTGLVIYGFVLLLKG